MSILGPLEPTEKPMRRPSRRFSHINENASTARASFSRSPAVSRDGRASLVYTFQRSSKQRNEEGAV
eukprot:7047585-Pyramimonas_sp.AAC.1